MEIFIKAAMIKKIMEGFTVLFLHFRVALLSCKAGELVCWEKAGSGRKELGESLEGIQQTAFVLGPGAGGEPMLRTLGLH